MTTMKKIFNLMMASAIALGTFTACEDVPEPYTNPYDQMKPSEPEVVIEPQGDGTAANPWNVAALIEACNGLGSGDFLNGGADVYARGIVIETTDVSTQYGNATYYISDNAKGTNRFYVYRGKLLDGKSVENESDLLPGDSVVVCGKVKNYNGNTLEFDQGNYLVFYQKGEGVVPTLEAPGTVDAPLTVAQALDYINNKLGDATSPEGYVKGKIVAVGEVDTGQYGNATYTISDDGTDAVTLQIYRGYSLGGAKFTSANEIKAGDEVIVKGKLVNYKGNTPQFAQGSAIYSLNGKTSGGSDTPTGDAKKVTIAEFNAAAESNDVWYELTGTVKNLKDGDLYGNFDLEDATGSVYVYGLLDKQGGEKKKFQELAAAKGIKNGSKLTIHGTRGSFNDKIEVMNAYFVSIDNSGAGGGGNDTPSGEAKGDGTLANPFNAIAATNYASALPADGKSDNEVYIKGKISRIANNGTFVGGGTYGNATFYISDDGTQNNEFYIFRTLYLGNVKYTGGTDIKVGDEVIIYGKVMNYKGNTPETSGNESYLYSLNGKTSDDGTGGGGDNGGGGEGGSDVAETGDNGDFEQWADGKPVNWTTASTAGNATLEQSTDAHGGNYSVLVKGATANKRLAYKEMKLNPGTYSIAFYAKGMSEGVKIGVNTASVGTNISYGQYQYFDNIATSWQKIEAEITISTAGTYCFIVLNQKKDTPVDVLIDDFTVTLNGKSVIK